MFSTLTSRFIPFSLSTKTSSILEPTCWPSSDNLVKLTIIQLNNGFVNSLIK